MHNTVEAFVAQQLEKAATTKFEADLAQVGLTAVVASLLVLGEPCPDGYNAVIEDWVRGLAYKKNVDWAVETNSLLEHVRGWKEAVAKLEAMR